MIYIDPPYNTGNEFIYPDNFREGIDDYLRYSGQVSGNGIKLSTNTETGGRYHSRWLNMMYPRLFLARNLLREDGVIFVSIDDNEVHNLRMLMDEVFGSENFIANIVWQKKQSPQRDATYLSDMHDHILVYARLAKSAKTDSHGWQRQLLAREEEQDSRYSNPDDDPRGPWTSTDCTINKTADQRPNLYYSIVNPNTGEEVWPSRQRVWAFEKNVSQKLLAEDRLSWGAKGTNFPRLKLFLSEVQSGIVPSTWWDRTRAGDNQEATREIRRIFSGPEQSFDTPKPTRLIKRMLQISSSPEEAGVVLDFFAGSATTAHAVLDLNREDGGDRKFITVQLPEKTDNPDYPTIADIGKERIRRVIEKLNEEDDGKLKAQDAPPQDRGFKVFKLTSSNFKIWDGVASSKEPEDLAEQLRAFAENVLPDRSREDILFEILLKSGLPLTAEVERLEVASREVYAVSGGLLVVCLEDHVDEELVRAVVELEPERFVCLDAAFDGNDKLKTNAVLQMKDRGIEFRTV